MLVELDFFVERGKPENPERNPWSRTTAPRSTNVFLKAPQILCSQGNLNL